MKVQRKPSSINLPVWMDMAIRELARTHKRSLSGEIEFLIEEAVKNNPEFMAYAVQENEPVLEETIT